MNTGTTQRGNSDQIRRLISTKNETFLRQHNVGSCDFSYAPFDVHKQFNSILLAHYKHLIAEGHGGL